MRRRSHKIAARRLVLYGKHYKFSRRPDFFRRASCDLLSKFKLNRPVFGGTRRVALRAAYKLTADAKVTITITKGAKLVKRYKAANRAGRKTYRIALPAKHRARGDYKVRLKADSGAAKVSTVLVARRL